MIGTTCVRAGFFTNKVEELESIEYKWKLKVHQSSFSAALHE